MNQLALIAVLTGLCISSEAAWGIDPIEQERLPELGALVDQSSVSGLSSGGFMAAQFHVAYSQSLVGAGIVAGGPWDCAGANVYAAPLFNAISQCMNPDKYSTTLPDVHYLVDLAKVKAKDGLIDAPSNLRDDRIYLFSGKNDKVVVPGVVQAAVDFYQQLGVPSSQIRFDDSTPAGHGFITDHKKDVQCSLTKAPYINDCQFDQAEQILQQIYGHLNPTVTEDKLSGKLIQFDQRPFFNIDVSLDDHGYLYVPKECETEQCRVHVAFHGCLQSASMMGTEYVKETGYMEAADANRVVVLFPQVKKEQMNPYGCWDFWGYTSGNVPPYNYYTKQAPQMVAVKKMMDRLVSQRTLVQVGE